jgi:hypothetical protein
MRGFDQVELEGRRAHPQDLMNASGLSVLLLTTKMDVRYFTVLLRACPTSPGLGWRWTRFFAGFKCSASKKKADWGPYLAGGAEPGGYTNVISPARATPLTDGDVLMLNAGLVWDGYFCDYDRNWSIGPGQQRQTCFTP